MTISVVPSAVNEFYVNWYGLEGDTFHLYRSNSPTDGFELLSDTLRVPFYVDHNVNLFDEGNRYYYKVDGYSAGVLVVSSEVSMALYNQPDGVAHKVIYEANVALKAMNNPLVYILIKKRTNGRCPECWNPITKRTLYADCQTCFGTGRISGYYPAVPVRMSMDVSQLVNASGLADSDQVSLTPINAWMCNLPLVNPEDVVVDVMNRRYVIQSSIPRTRSQYVIRQVLQLVPLEKGHPAYNVAVDRSVMLK